MSVVGIYSVKVSITSVRSVNASVYNLEQSCIRIKLQILFGIIRHSFVSGIPS